MRNYLTRLFSNEACCSFALVLAAAIALLLTQSRFHDTYNAFLETPISITIDEFIIAKPLVLGINDDSIVFFFFVVGLEIISINCYSVNRFHVKEN